ncbi:hypothetical protein Ddye_031753 [Dipteronia dyeriana]|uniref:Uncharacterized protein n=1 Tax=Dipteronia dyeriana TaxID=168575 RepID=A0AAD9WMW6_9ROSI|nr:hypothetical protein Ddye_031753 [Dipteronia dyeriana]
MDKLPATLRQLKIVSCMNLKLFGQSSEIMNHDSISFGLGGDSSLSNMTSTSTLELRELGIWDCEELQSLPVKLHNLTHLELLSLSNCSSLMYFPVGGLPNSCLKSLQISECDNLRSLPSQLHMVTSLQNLTVCGCLCLMSFPEGGLLPNLVSQRVIDCENLIPLSYWDLHNLNHLRKYSFIGGCPDLGE